MKRKNVIIIIVVFASCLTLFLGALLVQHFNGWRVEFDAVPEADVYVECFGEYAPPEISAFFRGNLIFRNGSPLGVVRTGEADVDSLGDYVIEWSASKNKISSSVTQTVHVVDTTPPEITLVPETREYVLPTGEYDDPGFTATDLVDGDLTARVKVELTDTGAIYTVTDGSGNTASLEREIPFDDPIPPELKLKGESEIKLYRGVDEYAEPGFEAYDNLDGDVGDKVAVSGEVDVSKEGEYELEYTVTDSYGNTAEAVRTVSVVEPPAPELNLRGYSSMTYVAGSEAYREPGWEALHELEGDISNRVSVSGTVDTSKAGTYFLTYSVSDSFGHTVSKIRTVKVLGADESASPFTEPEVLPDKVIYLTFDDGPSAHTARLLSILEEYGVKATFFVVSYGYDDMIREEFRAGHSIGVHSVKHDFKNIYSSEAAFFADLQTMNDIIYAQTGVYTDIMRFPGGSSNTISRFNPGIMSRLVEAVTDAGYAYFDWNVSSADAGGTTSSDQVYRNVVNGVSGKSRSVVLMHDSKGYTVDAVERIIVWGLENGYTFLPLTSSSPTCHHPVNN